MSITYCKNPAVLSSLILGLFAQNARVQASLPGHQAGALPSQVSSFPAPAASDLIQTLPENPDIEAQVKGQYPKLERKESLPLGAIQHAWDQAEPTAGIYQVIYNPAEIIRVRCREMMATTLVFPAWERLDKVVVGDPGSFRIDTPRPNIVIIEPQEFIGLDSNLTAIGASGKVYSFYLRSEGFNSRNVGDLTVYIRVAQPHRMPVPLQKGASASSAIKSQLTDYLDEVTFDPGQLDFAFDMAGDAELAPERVYTDGIRTWFDYGSSASKRDLPAVYHVIDGIDTPINVQRDGNRLVAQKTGAFTLQAGQKVVCIRPTPKAGQ